MIMSVLSQDGLYERQAKIVAMPKSRCFRLDNAVSKKLIDNVFANLTFNTGYDAK
jgi:hypothetical protein